MTVRLVTSEHLLRQGHSLGHPEQKLFGLETLRRLRALAIDNPHRQVTIQMDVDPDYDRRGFSVWWYVRLNRGLLRLLSCLVCCCLNYSEGLRCSGLSRT